MKKKRTEKENDNCQSVTDKCQTFLEQANLLYILVCQHNIYSTNRCQGAKEAWYQTYCIKELVKFTLYIKKTTNANYPKNFAFMQLKTKQVFTHESSCYSFIKGQWKLKHDQKLNTVLKYHRTLIRWWLLKYSMLHCYPTCTAWFRALIRINMSI